METIAPAQQKFVFTAHPDCHDCILESAKYKADWEVMLSLVCPHKKRPRRTSLHTLTLMLGRKDPLALAKEMEASGKVVGYVCPDVSTPIFYLKSCAMRYPIRTLWPTTYFAQREQITRPPLLVADHPHDT